MRSKESGKVRYAYGVAMALLLGGSAFSLATGQAGAQVAAERALGTSALAPRAGAPMSFADLVAKLQPAVVNISTKQRVPVRSSQADPFEEFFRRFAARAAQTSRATVAAAVSSGGAQPRTREAGSLGSGFIISPDGYIVTNNHLIQGLTGTGTVDTVTVTTTDRKEYPARIVGRDETSDLALLKIEGAQPAVRAVGRQHQGARRRLGDRDRRSLWRRQHRHRRHHLGAPPRDHERRRLRPLHPDRRRHQHGQQRRPDVRPQRQCHRHQLGADLADRRIGRYRPCHPGRARQAGHRRADEGPAPQRGYLGVGLQPRRRGSSRPLSAFPRTAARSSARSFPNGPAARARARRRATSSSASTASRSRPTRRFPISSPIPASGRASRSRSSAAASMRPSTCRSAERPTEEALAKISGGGADNSGTAQGAPGNGAAESARPFACAADAGARARGEPPGGHSRRDHHRRRPQQRCRRAGSAARRPHRVGQQPAGDHSGAGGCGRRCGAQGRPLQRAAAGQARERARGLRRHRHLRQVITPPSAALALQLLLGKGNGRR